MLDLGIFFLLLVYHLAKGAQISDTRSSGQVCLLGWRLIFAGRQYETCFMSTLLRLYFGDGSRILENFSKPAFR